MAKVSRALLPGARITAGGFQAPLPGDRHAGDFLILDEQVVHAGMEADLPAQGDDRLADVSDDGGQAVAAQVGLVQVEDVRVGAPAATNSSSTLRQRGSWIRVVSLPSENVPAPPFAEVQVGIDGQPAARPEALHVPVALVDRLAPFQEQRPIALARQQQSGEEPGRPAADHQRRPGKFLPARGDRLV